MDSSKSKIQADDFGGRDRISGLPDEILLHILSYLFTKDIIVTSSLSSRWKSLWKLLSISNFDFDLRQADTLSLGSVQREVQEIHDGARIGKFRFYYPWSSDDGSKTKIKLTSLLSNVVKHKVEVLDLGFSDPYWSWNQFRLPDSLFTCDSLTKLQLDTYMVRIIFPTSVCFPRLKTLHLTGVIQEHHAEQLFSGCPILEELHLNYCTWNNNNNNMLNISIAPLKRLILHLGGFDTIILNIICLELQSLTISCQRFELYDCVVPSLAEAHIRIGGVTYDYSQTLLQKLARNTLELLDRICNVKSLQLTANTLEAISHAEKLNVDRHQAFNNLTHLTVSYGLTYYSFDVVAFMHILHKSPNLQSLNFPTGLNLDGHILQEVAHVPLCLKRSLKKFSISQLKGKEEDHRRFLKLILTNANVLDYFSVHCSTKYPEKKMLDEYLSGFVRSNCVYRFV